MATELGLVETSQVLTDRLAKAAGTEQIGNWLARIGMVEYAPSFHAAGFDDARFLLTTGLSDAALDAMNVVKPGHRAKLQSLYLLRETLPSLVESEDDEASGEEESSSGGSSSGSGSESEAESSEVGSESEEDDDSASGSESE